MKKPPTRPPASVRARKATASLSDPHDRQPDPSLESPGHDPHASAGGNPQAHADGSVSIVREGSGRSKRG